MSLPIIWAWMALLTAAETAPSHPCATTRPAGASAPSSVPASMATTAPTSTPTSAPASAPATAPTSASAPATTRPAPPERTDPAALRILHRLERAGREYPNIVAELYYREDMLQTGLTVQRRGRVYYQAAAGKNPAKFRIHFETVREGRGRTLRRPQDYLFDGQFLTVRKEKIKQQVRYQVAPPGRRAEPLKLGRGPFPVPFGQKAETVLKYFRVSTRPARTSDPAGTEYLKLLTRPQHRREISAVWLEVWVQRKTALPVKIVTQDASENRKTAVFSRITTPRRMPRAAFRLPPTGLDWEVRTERWRGSVR